MEFFSIVGILVVNGKAWSAVAKNNANDLNGRSKKIYGCEAPRIMTIITTGGWWAHNNTYIWQWFRKWQCFKIALIYWRQANA